MINRFLGCLDLIYSLWFTRADSCIVISIYWAGLSWCVCVKIYCQVIILKKKSSRCWDQKRNIWVPAFIFFTGLVLDPAIFQNGFAYLFQWLPELFGCWDLLHSQQRGLIEVVSDIPFSNISSESSPLFSYFSDTESCCKLKPSPLYRQLGGMPS